MKFMLPSYVILLLLMSVCKYIEFTTFKIRVVQLHNKYVNNILDCQYLSFSRVFNDTMNK